MATMEKPKTKKSKVKPKPEISKSLTEDEERQNETTAIVGQNNLVTDKTLSVDFDQFATTSAGNIVSQECYIASDYVGEQSEDAKITREESDDQLSLAEELTQEGADPEAPVGAHPEVAQLEANHEVVAHNEVAEGSTAQKVSAGDAAPTVEEPPIPTAPIADVSTSVAVPSGPADVLPNPQYPNLSPLQLVETKSKVVYQTKKTATTSSKHYFTNSQLVPFTLEQQKQLYNCGELDFVKQFELDFLMNSLLETYENDPLHTALLEYYNLQSKLSMNVYDVEKARKAVNEAQKQIWGEIPVTKTFSAKCGDKVLVKESVTYNVAQVNGKNLENTSAALKNLYDLVCNTYTTNLITAKITKVKIDQMIDDIISTECLMRLAQNEKITLQKVLDSAVIPYVAQLRRSISILFNFMRKLSPNKDFSNDLKIWLRKVIALHLLIATKEDHWFLLFNILRCPIGVGNWATEFFQIPIGSQRPVATAICSHDREIPLDLNSEEMNHCIATLQILLLPVTKRTEYLKDFEKSHKEISDPAREERWILIDSDGEDSHNANGECVGLKESDLIALLNQIPFEKIFISALKIEKFLNDYIISPDLILANDVLRVIIFFSRLIEIFGEGMLTYNTERYKQLAKRLGRLIRHTLQYSTDYYELFMHNEIPKDARTCERISVELNALLFKACRYIYRSRNLATWQYFSSLPFNSLDADVTWQIFYYLNVGFPTELPLNRTDYWEVINTPDFWKQFNVANADSSAEDLYYLLQAFFEMANERDRAQDWDLIKTICLHIFNIGFINANTRETCYKTSRDMLVNLTLSYEELITCLLLQLKVRFYEIENGTYLIKSLPLENWKPGMDSFEILSNWLLHFDYTSQENTLARIVISHLNWGFDYDGRLFLPHNIHVRMACLITESLNKHAPEIIGLSGISESVRQVSTLMDLSQSTKEQFTTWCWTMVSLLRLHLMDQCVESIKRTLRNPTESLMFIPELEHIEMIYQGVTENRPLAVYVAVLVSLHGHTIPLICQRGLELMKLLLNDYRHAAVIRCIELIVPLFLETPETLANCENFHAILNSLLSADRTYLKMAKDIIYPNSIGPVLALLDNMIHHQITSYTDYGLSSPMNLINAWLNLLTALPNWQNTSVVYLLDMILRIAYQFSDARFQAVEFFYNYFKGCDEWKGASKLSTLKTLFGSAQLRVPTVSPLHSWLALVLLEIEFKTQEAHFWPEFLRQLAMANGKGCMEAALKKTTTLLKITNTFPAQMLVIYKYANVIASMDISQPIFPILCQKFFELYLSRVPLECDEYSFGGVYGVSDKFYDFNAPLMKKVSANLKAADAFYSNEATKRAAEESLSIFYGDCSKIMKSYDLWLHETGINQHTKDDCNFPPQYNNEKLREILNGNTSHWTEFIYLPDIRKTQKHQAQQWARKCHRTKSIKHLRSPLPPKAHIEPVERIKQHLSSYDKGQEAPAFMKPVINIPNEITNSTFMDLKAKIKTLNSMANKFHYETSELSALNRNYLDKILNLYKMVPYDQIKIKSCDSLLFKRQCSSPATIVTRLEQIRVDSAIEAKINKYMGRHDEIIDGMLKLNVEEFARCVEQLSGIMRILIASNTTQSTTVVTNTGTNFFYAVVENLTDVTIKFQPTNDLYSQLLYELNIFVHANQAKEGLNILELALRRADLIKELAAAFVPYRTPPQSFLKMYKFLVESYLKRCDTKILFVLLSKFDLVTWLENFQPKLNDINELLKLVLQGLECWSQPDSSLLQDQFRRHLVHVFDHDFPQHYGEVLQMVLDRISEQKLMPIVLLDLLNSLLARFKCKTLSINTKTEEVVEVAIDFARRQNLFNLKGATDTVLLFARHFQKERLHHGLHGLYPKHKDYCNPLAMWFSCMGHVVVVTAICTFQDLLADQISEVVFGSVIELFAPWLIPYSEEALQQTTSNWIRQLTVKDKLLSPWSEQYAPKSKIMIRSLIDILNFVLENLPISHVVLTHIFGWYVHHFAIPKIDFHVYMNIHEGMGALPWERFKPQPAQIDLFHDKLQKFVPSAHAMLGHIFIRISWIVWFEETLPTIPSNTQAQVISRLFTIFVKISFEPNIHININTSRILEDAIKYPWYMVSYAELESLFNWLVNTVDYAIILQIPSETNYTDRAVLDLLRLSCAMMPEKTTSWEASMQPINYATAKRILYTRNYIRLLCLAATKNHKLMSTKEGINAFNSAFTQLLNTIEKSIRATKGIKTVEEQKREALNLMVEILVPMQTQRVETSNNLVDTIIQWQAQCDAGNFLICSTFNAVGHLKTFISGIYPLLESTIAHYFRTTAESKDWHTPTWSELWQILQTSLAKMDLMPVIHGPYFFILHIFFIYKIDQTTNSGDKITFLQDVCQLLEGLKTNPYTEPRSALVWGAVISRGCQLLCETQNAKKVLLMFASYMCLTSTQTEGWGDTLMGAIGLRTDVVTNKRKALARCLACVLYSLFPHTSSAGPYPNDEFELSLYELTVLLANKKFADIKPQIVMAIGVIKDESTPVLREVPQLVWRLIGIFYNDDFLATVAELWNIDSRFT
ncbi:PREDICTED: ectopic P granules protein 5 homolog isoform X2 [Rhagoletis zephyria]|uniref:ectopic P granules protein 5 homolog isoform X2 n=1 Tax=Rhagoletis zephyria TaxID=28612 RepID=UPI000811538E|nr:PREDICTED: ectopic P granules protein 5 homolog isoform X2 [Rhagoletis zephyria]